MKKIKIEAPALEGSKVLGCEYENGYIVVEVEDSGCFKKGEIASCENAIGIISDTTDNITFLQLPFYAVLNIFETVPYCVDTIDLKHPTEEEIDRYNNQLKINVNVMIENGEIVPFKPELSQTYWYISFTSGHITHFKKEWENSCLDNAHLENRNVFHNENLASVKENQIHATLFAPF